MSTNPLPSFVERCIQRGYKGFSLHVRTKDGLELVDEYSTADNVASIIYGDAQSNAEGFPEPFTSFVLQAEGGKDSEKRGPTRSFSVSRGPTPHEVDRYDTDSQAIIRMLLEHQDKMVHVMTSVIPQNVEASAQIVSAFSNHFSTIANTHGDAIGVLREGKIEALTAERDLIEAAEKSERINKLIDMGMAVLMQMQAAKPPMA